MGVGVDLEVRWLVLSEDPFDEAFDVAFDELFEEVFDELFDVVFDWIVVKNAEEVSAAKIEGADLVEKDHLRWFFVVVVVEFSKAASSCSLERN